MRHMKKYKSYDESLREMVKCPMCNEELVFVGEPMCQQCYEWLRYGQESS